MAKKVNKIEPTERQKKAFALMAEDGRNKGKVMREAGFSESTAKKPTRVTRTKGWQQLVEEFLPDDLLTQKHKELLNVPTKKKTFKKGELLEVTEELDSNAVKAGLDMAYKIKGHYLKDNEQKKSTVVINVEKAKEIEKALDDI